MLRKWISIDKLDLDFMLWGNDSPSVLKLIENEFYSENKAKRRKIMKR
jgi:hypothetical protein